MKPRILVIQFKNCTGIPNGGALANQRCISMAEAVYGKENVVPYYMTDGKKVGLWAHLQEILLFPWGYYRGLTPSKLKEILHLAQEFDAVMICTSIYGLIAKRLKESGYQGRILTHFHNVESIYYQTILPKWLPGRSLLINCTWKNDQWSILYADASMALSQRDSDLLFSYYGQRVNQVIPMSFPDRCKAMTFDKEAQTAPRPTCCFIGSNFPANSEGLLWFIREVLPSVDVHFVVVGKDMDKLQQERKEMADIEVHSNVPDLTPYYLEADFLVMPIFAGSGIKVKTCEAMMYGKTILGTNEAFEGYTLDTQQVGALCNTAQEFIDAIHRIQEHPQPRYNAYARQVYLSTYTEEFALSAFQALFAVPV